MTATPAAHTTAYFSHKVFEYSYKQAVEEGYLVDYDAVNVRSEVRMQGVFLHEGENVELVDRETGLSKMDQLEDESGSSTPPNWSRRSPHPPRRRRLSRNSRSTQTSTRSSTGGSRKTLIFGANDLPHVSHADQLVNTARGSSIVATPSSRRLPGE